MRPGDDEEEKKEPVTVPVQTNEEDVYKQKEEYLNNTPTEKKEPLPIVGKVDITKIEPLPLTFANRKDELQYKVNQGTWMTDPTIRWNEVKGMLPNVTGAQALQQINAARENAGQKPMSKTELLNFLGDADPYKTEKERKSERRRALWAEGLTQLGEILKAMHAYAVTRRTGHYAAPKEGPTVGLASRLRAASEARAKENRDVLAKLREAEEQREYEAALRAQARKEKKQDQQDAWDHEEKVNERKHTQAKELYDQKLESERAKQQHKEDREDALRKQKILEDKEMIRYREQMKAQYGTGKRGSGKTKRFEVYNSSGKPNAQTYTDVKDAYQAYLRETGIPTDRWAAIVRGKKDSEMEAELEAHKQEMIRKASGKK